MSYYTLTFVPGCNKNLYYILVLSEGSKDEVEKVLSDLTSTDNLEDYSLCNPFECESENFDFDKCDRSCMKNKSHKAYCFKDFDVSNIKKLSKNFVFKCCESMNHFRIDKWDSKSEFSKSKKSFIKQIHKTYL
jgi:hypothetical protein